MESDNDSNVAIVAQGDSVKVGVKRSYFSKGDTPGTQAERIVKLVRA